MTTAFLWTLFIALAALVVLAVLVRGVKRLVEGRGQREHRQFHDH